MFLQAPAEVRIARLRARELAQLGRVDEEFIAWAARYDDGTMEGRSLPRHLAWLEAALPHYPAFEYEARCGATVLRLSATSRRTTGVLSMVRCQPRNKQLKRTVVGRRWTPSRAAAQLRR